MKILGKSEAEILKICKGNYGYSSSLAAVEAMKVLTAYEGQNQHTLYHWLIDLFHDLVPEHRQKRFWLEMFKWKSTILINDLNKEIMGELSVVRIRNGNEVFIQYDATKLPEIQTAVDLAEALEGNRNDLHTQLREEKRLEEMNTNKLYGDIKF